MPTQLPEFPMRDRTRVNYDKYDSLFDGKVWRVHPSEYDYDEEDVKAMASQMKAYAYKKQMYLRTFITADNHIIVQRRPLDYTPKKITRRKKKDNDELLTERV